MALAQRFQQHPRPRSSIERCISLAGGPAHGKGGFAHHFAITPGPALSADPQPAPASLRPHCSRGASPPPRLPLPLAAGPAAPAGPGARLYAPPAVRGWGSGGEREICAFFIFFAIFLFLLFCNSPLPPIPSSSSASQ